MGCNIYPTNKDIGCGGLLVKVASFPAQSFKAAETRQPHQAEALR
jgi:hypothetical protein